MRIISFGDVHMATAEIRRLHPELERADLVLVCGDLTNFGGKTEAAEVIATIWEACHEVLAVPGNLDRPEVLDLLQEQGLSLHGSGRRYGGLGLVGCGGSNPTPFKTPFELEEEEIGEVLRRGWKEVADAQALIVLCHTPPQGTKIDRLRDGRHVGSPAVRQFLAEVGPRVCLSGHVHEAVGIDRIGPTTLTNPGPLGAGGYLVLEWTEGPEIGVELRTL